MRQLACRVGRRKGVSRDLPGAVNLLQDCYLPGRRYANLAQLIEKENPTLLITTRTMLSIPELASQVLQVLATGQWELLDLSSGAQLFRRIQ